MLQQTIYIFKAVRTENSVSQVRGLLLRLVLKVPTNLRFLLLWLPARFPHLLMRENLLPRVLSIKIICLGFSHSRETGKKRSMHFREEESFGENIQNLCTKKKRSVYFAIHIHPTYRYCRHAYTRTHTHPGGLTHLKSMKAAAIGQSEDLACPTDVLNPSAVVKSMPESLEFYWKCFCPAEGLFRTVTL